MRSALHKATSQLYGSSDFICSLLDSGYSPNEKDVQGRTSLHLSASQTSQNSDIFQCLLDSGGNPDKKDEEGDTALHKACRCNNMAVVEMILSRGCNLNHQNKMGRTALHVAAAKVYVMPAIIRLLLESGSNPDIRDKKGNTPFDLLEKARNPTPLYDMDRKPSKKLLKEYENIWQLGLPFEVKDLDKQAANVFTRLLEEEGYNHFEARVMLAGEQGTGKSTIARYLVGKRPTRTRKSTDGIDLFNGLSFIERETKKWIRGKQGFTISELAISRSLGQRMNISDTPNYQQLISKDLLVTAKPVKCTHVTSDIGTKETLIQDEHVIGEIDESFDVCVADASSPVQNQNLQSKDCSHEEYIKQPFISTSTNETSKTRCNASIKPLNVSAGEYNVISLNKENLVITPLPVCSYTIPVEYGENKFSTIESPAFAEEMMEVSKSGKIDCTSTIIELTSKLTDGDGKILASQDLTSPRLLSTTAVEAHCMQSMSLERRNLTCDLDNIDGNENVKTAQHNHGELSGEDVFYTRSMSDQFPVQNKCLENKYSFSLGDIDSYSKPSIRSQEISCTEVVKDQTIIGKLKTTFGVKKDVSEIKVWMTKDRFLMESIKAGKKKLHQQKIAPVIIWDFGGQDVFYSTHQTFLTYRAIYLIVLDGSRTLDEPCPFEQYLPGKSGSKTARDYLRFWINTIVTYCKGSAPGFPKIMVVLTHKDKLKAAAVEPRRQQIFDDIENMFSGSPLMSHLVIKEKIFVNARKKGDPEMTQIKQIITEQAMNQPSWGQKLPTCFIPLELEFDSLLSRKISLITMEQMRKINSFQPVRPLTEEELKVFLKFQHSVGRILYFDVENLDEHIILSPTHLIDAFKSIVTDRRFCKGDTKRLESWDLMSKKGIIEKNSIDKIWKKKKYIKFKDHKEYLLGVMTHLDILVEPKRYDKFQTRISAEFYYVASMVRTNDTTGYLMSPTFTQSNIAIAFSHSSSMIPPALSFRFISYCLSIFAVKKYGQKDDELLFHRSAVFNIDQSLDMCVNCDDEIIVVRLVHLQNRTLIMRDLASSIRECLAVALEKIGQLYVKTSSADFVASKSSFNLSLCCSSSDDPCLLPISTLQQQDGSWVCPKHEIEHTKDMLSSWAIQKDEIQCGKSCPVINTEFLDQTPSDIHLRRLSMQYGINETKELIMHLGMDYQTWDDLYVTFGEEPERLKFEALHKTVVGTHLTFNDIRKAVEIGKIQTIHSLCKVVRDNLIDFDQEPEKWDLVPTEEHLDRVAPLVGNNSLSFLVELGLKFRTWEEIKYKQAERDLVKLNRHILQEWKSNFCSLHNIRPSLRDIGKAFNNIGKNIKIIENVLADLL